MEQGSATIAESDRRESERKQNHRFRSIQGGLRGKGYSSKCKERGRKGVKTQAREALLVAGRGQQACTLRAASPDGGCILHCKVGQPAGNEPRKQAVEGVASDGTRNGQDRKCCRPE